MTIGRNLVVGFLSHSCRISIQRETWLKSMACFSKTRITDRATVIIDKQGIVRYANSVTPAGERNPQEMLAEARKVNKG